MRKKRFAERQARQDIIFDFSLSRAQSLDRHLAKCSGAVRRERPERLHTESASGGFLIETLGTSFGRSRREGPR